MQAEGGVRSVLLKGSCVASLVANIVSLVHHVCRCRSVKASHFQFSDVPIIPVQCARGGQKNSTCLEGKSPRVTMLQRGANARDFRPAGGGVNNFDPSRGGGEKISRAPREISPPPPLLLKNEHSLSTLKYPPYRRMLDMMYYSPTSPPLSQKLFVVLG